MLHAARRRIASLRHRRLDSVTRALQERLELLESRPAAGLHGTYAGDGRMLVAPAWGGRLLIPSEDLSLMPELVTRGTYDVPFTAFVQRQLRPGTSRSTWARTSGCSRCSWARVCFEMVRPAMGADWEPFAPA
jgi:hypothetical protein